MRPFTVSSNPRHFAINPFHDHTGHHRNMGGLAANSEVVLGSDARKKADYAFRLPALFFLLFSLLPFYQANAKTVSFSYCPPRFPSCGKCPTDVDLKVLTPTAPSFPGAVSGAFWPHPVSGDSSPLASKVSWWSKETRFTIEQCCAICSRTAKCSYWTWRKEGLKGVCDLYGSEQCSRNRGFRRVAKFKKYDSITILSFKKCAISTYSGDIPSIIPSTDPSPSSPPPIDSSVPYLPPFSEPPSAPAPAPEDAPPQENSVIPSPPPPSPPIANDYCPVWPRCPATCPDSSTLQTLLTNPSSKPLGISAGRINPIYVGPAGNGYLSGLLDNAGIMSLGACCQLCSDRWQEECYLWNWHHEPVGTDIDRGYCRLYTKSTCSFMTEQGYFNQLVWDKTQPGFFASTSPC